MGTRRRTGEEADGTAEDRLHVTGTIARQKLARSLVQNLLDCRGRFEAVAKGPGRPESGPGEIQRTTRDQASAATVRVDLERCGDRTRPHTRTCCARSGQPVVG